MIIGGCFCFSGSSGFLMMIRPFMFEGFFSASLCSAEDTDQTRNMREMETDRPLDLESFIFELQSWGF